MQKPPNIHAGAQGAPSILPAGIKARLIKEHVMAQSQFIRAMLGATLAIGASLAFAAPGTCIITPANLVIEAGESAALTATCTGPVTTLNWKEGASTFTGDVSFASPQPANTPFYFHTPRSLAGGNPSTPHTITLTATDGTSVDATTIVSVRQGPSLAVTMAGDGAGTVTSSPSGINCTTGTCNASFPAGTAITLTASTGGNASFGSWSGDCTGTGTCNLTLTASRAVTATFAAVANGTCGAANGVGSANAPNSGLCTAGTATAVSTGASAHTWSCQGIGGGTTAACSAPKRYTITASVSGANGTVAPSTQDANHGDPAPITASPTAGFSPTFTVTSGGCSGATSGNVFTVSATNTCAVSVSFSNAPTAGVCGTDANVASAVAPTDPGLCNAGAAGAVTPSGANWAWQCAGLNGGATASCTAPQIFTVTPSVASGTGTISPSTPVNVNGGATTQFTVTPGSGLAATMGGTCPAGSLSGNTYTTGTIVSNCTVTATFAAPTSPSNDPGQYSGFWAPPGTSDWIIADPMGPLGNGSGTYLPSCLNQAPSPSSSSSGCAIQTTGTTGPLAGGGSYTYTMAANRTLGIRFTSNDPLSGFSRTFKVQARDGGSITSYPSVSMWLATSPTATYDSVTSTACKKTGGATQTIVTHQTQSGTCNIVPGTLYYLFIRVNGACTTTGSSCNLLVADNFDFH